MNELWSTADMHLHTTGSDGVADAEQVVAYVAAHTDLRVIAITDHDTLVPAREAQRLSAAYGVAVIRGEEVSTQAGHVLALFIERAIPAGRPLAQTIAAIHAQGGLAIAPHPFDASVPSLGMAAFADGAERCDAIEGFNAGVIWSQRGANAMAQQIGTIRGFPLVGGSDAHTLATIGQGYTRFRGSSADDLYRAIQRGQVGWGGHYWTAAQYYDLGWQTVRQRGMLGALRLAAAGAGMITRLNTAAGTPTEGVSQHC